MNVDKNKFDTLVSWFLISVMLGCISAFVLYTHHKGLLAIAFACAMLGLWREHTTTEEITDER